MRGSNFMQRSTAHSHLSEFVLWNSVFNQKRFEASFRVKMKKCRGGEFLLADASQYLGGEFFCPMLLAG